MLRNGRAVGKVIPLDQRRAAIHGLQVGNHYSLQVVPMTHLSTIKEGEGLFTFTQSPLLRRVIVEYDPEQHAEYLPGPQLEVDFRDLVEVPSKIWVESITGRSAVVCWSTLPSTSNAKNQPEGYRLFLWNSEEQTREQAKIISLASKDNPSLSLSSLVSLSLSLSLE